MNEHPKLRNGIDIIPVEISGLKVLLLRDRLNLSQELTLSMDDAPFLPFLNGKHSVRDIQAAIMRQSGFGLVSTARIQKVIDLLDSYYYLENDNFISFKTSISEEFNKHTLRRSSHAGKSYESDPSALKERIEGFFSHPDGPGPIAEKKERRSLRGLIAPHIDFERGGTCYAWAYKGLAEHCKANLFIILGTAHYSTEKLFVLTEKDFETPLGTVKTGRAFVRLLSDSVGEDLFTDELLHRSEHVIEFQLIFLQYLYGTKSIEIVPILCGSFNEIISKRVHPIDIPQVATFVKALKESIESYGKKTCMIASADLSHVGPQFGDSAPVSTADLSTIERKDLHMLEFVRDLDPDGFYQLIMAEGDQRNICGLAPIYTLLKTVDAKKGNLLKYSQAHHPQATVTFTSISFHS